MKAFLNQALSENDQLTAREAHNLLSQQWPTLQVSLPSTHNQTNLSKIRVGVLRAKHLVQVHVWGGISKRGATNIIIFTGIMNAERLGMIFEVGLLPFVRDHFPDGHRL